MSGEVQVLKAATPRPGVRLLILNRPAARNALNAALCEALNQALDEADRADDVSAVVLTGAGTAFSGGVDLAEGLAGGRARLDGSPADRARQMSKPVIAAVNGPCYTGALELALSCSFVVASVHATFADTHAAVGLVAGWGMSALLPRAVGERVARQMMTTGEPIDAAVALRVGLVNEVADPDHLLDRALELGELVAAADPDAVRTTISLLKRTAGLPVAEALAEERRTANMWQVDVKNVSARFAARLAR